MNEMAGNATEGAALASRHVQPQTMEWRATKFEGVEVKPLYIDRDTGMMTVMMRMAPGAILPDHEHVGIEQTIVLEGSIEDTAGSDKGLSVGAGEYVVRPSGSRHAAWSPNGGLMIGVFQMPNKFFEPNGEVVDFLGNDWEKSWGAARRGR